MSDEIIITYWEGDDVQHATPKNPKRPFTALTYAEWTRNGRAQWARADENKFNFGEETPCDELGDGQVRAIPDDVRETIALMIAPSLRKTGG